jgi:chemotaxis signal transduction protein
MNSTIFYVNSVGFLCQWKGQVVRKDAESVVVRFSKSKVLKFSLKALDCPLFIVTKRPIKACGLAVDQAAESTSYDDATMEKVKALVQGNIELEWNSKGWAA